ncbi:MAG TPA: MFS transporter [Flavitalea sp.]|nr:MFS transporter [Flavitalea sp.]
MPEKTIQQKTIARISARILPFLLLMYILAFLDRANLGFAKNAFQADTNLSDTVFAFGAGIFFIGYSIFEIPSNLILHRVGARRWMCRIMISWGIVSALMMFAHNTTTFYLFRFLLGVMEAGFFPGVIYYLTYWYPSAMRARSIGLFYFGIPLALILGGPLSGWLLELDGSAGLKGWQWMFMVEGILATLVGIWAFWYLDDQPATATWLNEDEKRSLKHILEKEESVKNLHGPASVSKALTDGRVLYLCSLYFLIQLAFYGVVYYLPSQVAMIVQQKVGFAVGLLTTIPWMCALVAAYLVSRYSDKTGERKKTASAALLFCFIGIITFALSHMPVISMIGLCFSAAGIIAVQPVFWTLPTSYLTGTAAAGGIAFINSLGTLGGFVAPNLKTWAEIRFHSPAAGMFVLAASALAGAMLVLVSGKLGLKGKVETAISSQGF